VPVTSSTKHYILSDCNHPATKPQELIDTSVVYRQYYRPHIYSLMCGHYLILFVFGCLLLLPEQENHLVIHGI
jgi:hypothetical protein